MQIISATNKRLYDLQKWMSEEIEAQKAMQPIKLYSIIKGLPDAENEAAGQLQGQRPERATERAVRLPTELGIPEARALLDVLKDAGYCVEGYKWSDKHTQYEATAAAWQIYQTLKEQGKWRGRAIWKPFAELWGFNSEAMARARYEANVKANQESLNKIQKLFEL